MLHYDIDYVDPRETLLGLALGAATTTIFAVAAHRQRKAERLVNTLQPKIEPRKDDIVIRR